jgi:prepilin-type N-terminal cleavage/methylation domain-containing protein
MSYTTQLSRKQGFTLIEILISIGILSIVLGVSFLSLSSYKNKQSFDLDVQNVAEAVRNAQNRAMLGEGGAPWGIKFTSNVSSARYEIFSGSAYATSSVVLDETLSAATNFLNPAPGYSKTLIFTPVTGVPDGADSIVMRRGTDNASLVTIAVSSLGKVSRIAEKSLAGYWPMDESLGTTAFDASGNGNNGTLTGTLVWSDKVQCRVGKCLGMDATATNYVAIPNNSQVDAQTTLTLSAWIYPRSTGGSDSRSAVIFASSYYLSYNDSSKNLSCYWYNTNPEGYHETPSGSVPLNRWSHIACVWDGSQLREYVNGQLLNTVAVTQAGRIAGDLQLGSEGIARQLDGYLDDVRIYTRALSDGEMKSLYQSY